MGAKPRQKPPSTDDLASAATRSVSSLKKLQALLRQTGGEVSESKARRIEKYVGELASITEDQPSEISRWPVRIRSNLPFDILEKIIPVKLKENGGNVSSLARELDTSRMQVHRWLKKLGINLNDYREDYRPGLTKKDYALLLPDLLTKHSGDIAAVAEELGRSPLVIRRHCKRMGLPAH